MKLYFISLTIYFEPLLLQYQTVFNKELILVGFKNYHSVIIEVIYYLCLSFIEAYITGNNELASHHLVMILSQ